MGDLPQIKETYQQVVQIQVPVHWLDHHFQQRPVLPAVEAMQLLAHWSARRCSINRSTVITQAKFEKFLNLPPDGGLIECLWGLTQLSDGALRSALMSKIKAKSATFSRTITHAQVDFTNTETPLGPLPLPTQFTETLPEPDFTVTPQAIYDYLVPFGAAYRNIAQPLQLFPQGAIAQIEAPRLSDGQTAEPLGSAFVLDAAFHAACVWGQRYTQWVAFPVGFDKRIVQIPTRPGRRYVSWVLPKQMDERQLYFDIWILDADHQVAEAIYGLRMRDVSGGRLTPPPWIRAK